jgi:Zn-dependent protease with chaperone function
MQLYTEVNCTLHTRDTIRTSISDGTALRYFHILSVASAADTVLVGSFPSKPCSHSGRALLLFPLLLLLLLLLLLVLQSVLYGVLMLVAVVLLDSLCVVQPELVLELVLEVEEVVEVEAETTVLSS